MDDKKTKAIRELNELRAALQDEKFDLDIKARQAARQYKQTGVGLPDDEFLRMQLRIKHLGNEISKIDRQLGELRGGRPKNDDPEHALLKCFREEVQAYLGADTFDMLMRGAEARYRMSGGPNKRESINGNR